MEFAVEEVATVVEGKESRIINGRDDEHQNKVRRRAQPSTSQLSTSELDLRIDGTELVSIQVPKFQVLYSQRARGEYC